jgi:KUP system potassium uptake protein
MQNSPDQPGTPQNADVLTRAIAAIGIVYGDIGTSPLYTMRECFAGAFVMDPTPDNILGILSVIFWAMLLVTTVKYVIFILRADNEGEGGILALHALIQNRLGESGRAHGLLPAGATLAAGLFGAALLYGDSMITPAISVLSAIEGLDVATPMFSSFVVPATLVILTLLFLIQRHGTGTVGTFFGPLMCLWFVVLAVLGGHQIAEHPEVLAAVSPYYAVNFFWSHGWPGFMALGAVVLALTGAEALYADMGHFGRTPIRMAWFIMVFPSLLINYFGQGALLLGSPEAVSNPFYLLAPAWALYPLVGLSTAATVIASQAVISGAFSLTRQAVQLGYFPRLEIIHTSSEAIGQIYIPRVNWGLLATIFPLVLIFQSSSNLAAAYGVAVTATMVLTTLLFHVVLRRIWGWNALSAGLIIGFFLIIDLSFFASNAIKISEGGWLPLVLALATFILFTTWKRGRKILFERLTEETLPLDQFLKRIAVKSPIRVPGTSIFMTGSTDGVPHALLHNLKHNKVLHERVVLLTVVTRNVPHVPQDQRIAVTTLPANFYRILVSYGFTEDPDVPRDLEAAIEHGLDLNMMDTSFFLGRETLYPARPPKMALWREVVFIWMSRNAISATDFFKIPPNRVVELGTQIGL